MTGTGVLPAWVIPPLAEIEDVFWMARAARESSTESARIEARGAAVTWVLGGSAAPVTGRTDMPVTWGLASAELWAALMVCDRGCSPRLPGEELCAAWGVRYMPPVVGVVGVGLAVGDGVARALGWLLGSPGLEERPLRLPRRDADGRVLTAEELYAQVLAHSPQRFRSKEARLELSRWAQDEASFSAAAAEWIEVTKRRAARGSTYPGPLGTAAAV